MKSGVRFVWLCIIACSAVAVRAELADESLRLMRYPAIAPDGKLIAFTYNGDIYTVPAEGGKATCLVKHEASDLRPRFSPDGKTLAFNSTRGNGFMNIYTIPVAGGEVSRLTFHSAGDTISDWTPDGKQILFTSTRDTRFAAVHSLDVQTGKIRTLIEDDRTLSSPTMSPDRKTIVYQRGGAPWWRKGYRGSNNAELYAFDLATKHSKRLTTFNGNDEWPLCAPDGKTVYFVSDRPQQPNLWKMNADGSRPQAVTTFSDDDVQFPHLSRNGKTLVFEYDHRLYLLGTTEGPSTSLRAGSKPVEVKVWLPEAIPLPPKKTETLTSGATEFEVSPDGRWIAFVVKGEIFLTDAVKGGEVTRLTDNPARDNDLSWSPDSKSIAFVSTRNANSDIYLLELATKKLTRMTSAPEADTSPKFSPDGKTIAFIRGPYGAALMSLPVPSGDAKPSSEALITRGPFINNYEWSPQGEWIAFSKQDEIPNTNVWIVASHGVPKGPGDVARDVTNYAGNNANMQWTGDGKYLVFRSDRGSAQPGGGGGFGRGGGFVSSRFYAIDLDPNTFRPVSGGAEPINFENIQERAHAFTSTGGAELALGAMPDRQNMVFVSGSELFSVANGGGTPVKVASAGVGAQRVTVTPDGNRFYLHSLGSGIRYVERDKSATTEVPFKVTIETDPRREQAEAFDEGWRLLNNDFYDARMHGCDWNKMREKYRPLLAHCWSKGDFILLMSELIGELNGSHLGVGGALFPGASVTGPQTGSLGVLLDQNYDGPGVRVASVMRNGPADKDGSRLFEGDLITKVGDVEVKGLESFHHMLLNQGTPQATSFTVTRQAGDGGVLLTITPLNRTPYSDLLYENWVDHNRAQVLSRSAGRLGYVHIREMNPAALQKFQREILGREYSRDAVIIDVRYNPGGRIHDELLSLLRKPHVYEYLRGTPGHPQPRPVYDKPMVLIINQNSGSDAEIFPNGFRAYGLGKIVGVPTYGAVIGTTNVPLMDGTTFRIPRTGWRSLTGTNLENYGVPPDVFVENLPDDYAAGVDHQLERACAEAMKSLKK